MLQPHERTIHHRAIPSSSERSQHQPKKQKFSHPARPPPSFWDNLSEIPLTENALHELDRRNRDSTQSTHSLSRKQSCRPVTRRFAAELMMSKVRVWPVFPASDASHFPELIPFPGLQGCQIRHTFHLRPRPIEKFGIPSALP